MENNNVISSLQAGPLVYAVRIYNDESGVRPLADLALGDGGRPNGDIVTIHWDSVTERNKYVINAYTLIWDERRVTEEYVTFAQYVYKNMTAKEYMRTLNDDELQELLYAIYMDGNKDGEENLCDSESGIMARFPHANAGDITKKLEEATEVPVHRTFKRKMSELSSLRYNDKTSIFTVFKD